MSKIEVDEIVKQSGSTLTLGGPGTAVTLGSGATQTGFGRTGTVDWCTTAKTSPFTAANGVGYFVNTTSGGVTVTLPPSPSAGDIVAIADLNGTFDCNAVVLCRNSSKIKGACSNLELTDERVSATIIYTGASQGWITVNAANETAPTLKPQTYNVRYLVVAGGGGGAPSKNSGVGTSAGGAGGFRTIACKSFTVSTGTAYSITVGAGGAGGTTCATGTPLSSTCNGRGLVGAASVFSTITSAGGGRSGRNAPSGQGGGGPEGSGGDGGSGGGGGTCSGSAGTGSPGGTGNTPPVSPPQGNNGGAGTTRNASPYGVGAGGGGAGSAGQGGGPGPGAGGAGAASTILGSSPLVPSYGVAPNPSNTDPGRYFAGGGGGGWNGSGSGGHGGGGAGGSGGNGVAGTANTGGGGGGDSTPAGGSGGNGGSGIVIISHATANGGSGGNVTGTCGSDTIRVFTGDGTFTA